MRRIGFARARSGAGCPLATAELALSKGDAATAERPTGSTANELPHGSGCGAWEASARFSEAQCSAQLGSSCEW